MKQKFLLSIFIFLLASGGFAQSGEITVTSVQQRSDGSGIKLRGNYLAVVGEANPDRKVILFDFQDGTLAFDNFFDLTPYDPGTLKHVIRVGDEFWVSDQTKDVVYRLDIEGNLLGKIGETGGIDNLRGMRIIDDHVWLANSGSQNNAPGNAVVRLSFEGEILNHFPVTGSPWSFWPYDNNNVLISFSSAGGFTTQIGEFTKTGTYLGAWNQPGEISFIQQVTPMQDGGYLATSFSNAIYSSGVHKYTSYGTYIQTVAGTAGSGARGAWELGNGNIMWTNGQGIHIANTTAGTSALIYPGSFHYVEKINFGASTQELPFTEGFESGIFNAKGWTVYNASGIEEWVVTTGQNHTPGGYFSAFHNYGLSGTMEDSWLVSPAIALPEFWDVELSFWSYNTWTDFYFKNSVLISTGDGDPACSDFVEVWSAPSVTSTWEIAEVDLSAFSGNTIYIAFRYEGDDAHGWYLDDIIVDGLSPFYPPYNLQTQVDQFDVTLTWEAPAQKELIGFKIYRNGELIDASPIIETIYFDQNLEVGIYYYQVQAIYFNGVSNLTGPVQAIVEPIYPDVSSNEITHITTTNATGGGEVTFDGGAEVTARGIVWSAAQSPTVDDHEGITIDGSGEGAFVSVLSGLMPETTYYVRAYATNNIGTGYGQEATFTTPAACDQASVTDSEGNSYNVMGVGEKCWMAENLRAALYRDGTPIAYPGADNTAWQNSTEGAYAWYNNDTVWKELYGALYNWHAVNNAARLCPEGWHIPSDEDWLAMSDFIGGTVAPFGNQLKSCRQVNSPLGGECNTTEHPRWNQNNTHYGTDDWNFSGLPGGFRGNSGTFSAMGSSGYWWSATALDADQAWNRNLNNFNGTIGRTSFNKLFGFSVRCIKSIPATVTTGEIADITTTTATGGGAVLYEGDSPVTARGLVWSKTENPTLEDHEGMTTEGGGTGSFSSVLTNLQPATIYYVRAYATNSNMTSYGNSISFVTDVLPPSNLQATVAGYDVNLTWTAPDLGTNKAKAGTNGKDNGAIELLGYNIYRNDELLDFTAELFYNDLQLTAGFYDYYVTAVYTNGESEPTETVTVQVGAAAISVSPDKLEEILQQGETVTRQLVIENNGDLDLEFEIDIDFINQKNTSSWVSILPSSGFIAPGQSVSVDVIFDATDFPYGIYNADIIVSSNDPDHPQVAVPAQMIVPGGIPEIEVSDYVLDFGTVNPGAYKLLPLTVTNNGEGVLHLSELLITDPSFSLTDQPEWIAPGSSVELEIVFSPQAAGPLDGMLIIYSNDPVQEEVYVFLIGTGSQLIVPPVNLQATAVEYDVHLEWEIPVETNKRHVQSNSLENLSESGIVGYNIYRNGVMIGFTSELFYDDTNVEAGIHEYYVTTLHNIGESLPSDTVSVQTGIAIISVTPDTLSEQLAQGETSVQQLIIENYGDKPLEFEIEIEQSFNLKLLNKLITDISESIENCSNEKINHNYKAKENIEKFNEQAPGTYFGSSVVSSRSDYELQFEYPVGVGGGEAGIETDGNFIYTTKWNGAAFYRYQMDGTFLGSFTIAGTNAVRDLAYDGTYFYGGAANTTVFVMDFVSETLISTFTAPTAVRAIAYDQAEDGFWANNWSTTLTLFSRTGATLNTIATNGNESFYGLAYDPQGPFLWGYSQRVGSSQNIIYKYELPAGIFIEEFDIAPLLSLYSPGDIAGGLAFYSGIIPGTSSLLIGMNQNKCIWGLKVSKDWITTDFSNGSVLPGEQVVISFNFHAFGLDIGVYNAEITIHSNDLNHPQTIVPVTLEVTAPGEFFFTPVWSEAYNPMAIFVMEANIEGLHMQAGDEVGLFDMDPNSGEYICVGAGVLVEQLGGGINLEIIASMDDGAMPGQANGFTPGNPIIYRLWSENTGEIITVHATYPYPDDDELYTPLGEAHVELNGYLQVSHEISLPQGWSGLSSYLNPMDNTIEEMFSPILSDLIILQSETGMYWPGENVNTIGAWNTHEGYKIKVANAVELTITGSRETNKTLDLAAGWNLIPVLSECAVDVEALFAGKDLVMVKEVAGWNLYWPEYGINTIGGLLPGKAYFVLMGSAGEIEFPECDGFKLNLTGFGNLSGLEKQSPWPTIQPTTSTHSVAVPAGVAGDLFKAGDIIGVFDQQGNCSGLGIWQGESTAITLFGNDATTGAKDGFVEGEPLQFRLYRPDSGEEFDLEVTFDQSLPNTEPVFATNGLSAISEIKMSATGVGISEAQNQIQIIPNPAREEFRLRIEDKDFNTGTLHISTMDGRVVKTVHLIECNTLIAISSLQTGVYILQIEYGNTSLTKRIVKY